MKYIFLLITTFVFAQQTKFVDFKSVSAQLTINDLQKTIQFYTDLGFKQNGKEILLKDVVKVIGKN